jgi:hypothetical protein
LKIPGQFLRDIRMSSRVAEDNGRIAMEFFRLQDEGGAWLVSGSSLLDQTKLRE